MSEMEELIRDIEHELSMSKALLIQVREATYETQSHLKALEVLYKELKDGQLSKLIEKNENRNTEYNLEENRAWKS